jgi:hypothetical protein
MNRELLDELRNIHTNAVALAQHIEKIDPFPSHDPRITEEELSTIWKHRDMISLSTSYIDTLIKGHPLGCTTEYASNATTIKGEK